MLIVYRPCPIPWSARIHHGSPSFSHVLHPILSRITPLSTSYRVASTLAAASGDQGLWRRKQARIPFFTDNQTLNVLRHSRSIPSLPVDYINKADDISSSWPPNTLPIEVYKPVPPLTISRTLKVYSQLSKARLSILVVLTAMSGVALSPLPATIPVLLSTALGTALCSASANTFNQISEVPFDAQMIRTRTRPLVRKAISPLHASLFGVGAGISGISILWAGAGGVAALLGAGNIILYSWAYTALKRRHVINTWVGAVVGAIPPLIGWSACGGALLPSIATPISLSFPLLLSSSPLVSTLLIELPAYTSGLVTATPMLDNPLAPWVLFLFHFAWQFPHFNSLSHITREGYAQAGYHMLSVLNPKKNALVALRHCALLTFLSSVLIPLSGLTTWWFAATSLVPNTALLNWSWKFWRMGGDKMAKGLWHTSLWYLPVMLGLMMYHKNGMEWLSWLGLRDGVTRVMEVDE